MYQRQCNIDCAHPCTAMMHKSTRKQTWNHCGAILVCSQGRTSKFSRNHYVPPSKDTRQQFLGLLTDFKKKMQQTKLHSRHLVLVKVPVNSIRLEHDTAQLIRVQELHQHDQKKGDLITRLSPSSLRPVSFK